MLRVLKNATLRLYRLLVNDNGGVEPVRHVTAQTLAMVCWTCSRMFGMFPA